MRTQKTGKRQNTEGKKFNDIKPQEKKTYNQLPSKDKPVRKQNTQQSEVDDAIVSME